MTEIRGIEAGVNALVTRLTDDLPAAVDEINQAAQDDHLIAAPTRILDYIPSLGSLYDPFTVAIGHGPGRFEDDLGFEAVGVYDVSVVAFVQDPDQQALARKVRRYQLALLRTVLQGRNLGSGTGLPWGMQLLRADFGPSLGDRPSGDEPPAAFLTWTTIDVRLRLDES